MAERAENLERSADDLEPQTALIRIEEINVPSVFGEGKVNPLLDLIRAQVAEITTDVSTSDGRAEIKSAAYKVARSKTLLDDAGKEYATELRKKLDGINGHRRKIRDALDTLKDTIRKPLTEWEEAEKQRADAIAAGINRFITAGQMTGTDSASIAAALAEVKDTEITEEAFGDRKGEAAIAKDVAVSNLERALAAAKKREDEAAELERLRKEKAEREQREAEERRVREAEDRAREKADREAQERIEAAERKTRETQEAAAAAEKAAEQDRAMALQEIQAIQEQTLIARTGRLGHVKGGTVEGVDKLIAETEAWTITPEKFGALTASAEAARQSAVSNLKEYRAELVREQEQKAEDARRQDREHRRKVSRAAADALQEWGELTEDQAQTVITVIAAGRIPAVTIRY